MAEKRKDSKGRNLRTGETQNAAGRYCYRYTDTRTGKRCAVYNTDLQALRKKEREIERNLEDGINNEMADITLNELFNIYLDTKSNIKKTSRSTYLRTWEKHVSQGIGVLKAKNLKQMDLTRMYSDMVKQGFAQGSIDMIHNLINACLQMAVDNDIVRKNVARKAKKGIQGKRKERVAMTIEEQNKFLMFCKNSNTYNIYYPMFSFAIKSALRVSELSGLTWNDVDEVNGILHVDHQLIYEYIKGDSHAHYYISKPKTKSGVRDIPLTKSMRKSLSEQKRLMMLLGRRSEYEIDGYRDFIFVSKNGRPLTKANIDSTLKRIIAAYNKEHASDPLPMISMHILRHTGCTRMAEAGIDPKVLQKIMGHSDIAVTMDVYNHCDDVRAKKEMERIEKEIFIA